MMLPRWISEFASLRSAIFMVILATSYFLVLRYVTTYPTLLAANGAPLLEMRWDGYSRAEAERQLTWPVSEHRTNYRHLLILDYLNALFIAFASILLLTLLLNRFDAKWWVLALLPLLGLAADCAENTLLLWLNASDAKSLSPTICFLASLTTRIKFFSLAASLLLALLALLLRPFVRAHSR